MDMRIHSQRTIVLKISTHIHKTSSIHALLTKKFVRNQISVYDNFADCAAILCNDFSFDRQLVLMFKPNKDLGMFLNAFCQTSWNGRTSHIVSP